MPETLTTPDGQPVAVPEHVEAAQRDFAQAMAADQPADVPAPPKRGEPQEKPDKPRRGRPPKNERARTSSAVSGPSGGKPGPAVKADYSEDAQALVAGAWTVAASIPFTSPYALVINANADALSSALAAGAKQSEAVRRFVSSGENTWKLQLASVGLSMGMQTLQLMKDPELREQARAKTQEQLQAALAAQGLIQEEPSDNQPEPS
jgi:hypothetical protein